MYHFKVKGELPGVKSVGEEMEWRDLLEGKGNVGGKNIYSVRYPFWSGLYMWLGGLEQNKEQKRTTKFYWLVLTIVTTTIEELYACPVPDRAQAILSTASNTLLIQR